MTKNELAKSIRSNMFGKRDTLEEAFNYLQSIIGNVPAGHGASVMTGVMVVMNTLADEMEKCDA